MNKPKLVLNILHGEACGVYTLAKQMQLSEVQESEPWLFVEEKNIASFDTP